MIRTSMTNISCLRTQYPGMGLEMFIRDASVRIFLGESEFCVTASSDLFLILLALRTEHVMEVVLDGSYSFPVAGFVAGGRRYGV